MKQKLYVEVIKNIPIRENRKGRVNEKCIYLKSDFILCQ